MDLSYTGGHRGCSIQVTVNNSTDGFYDNIHSMFSTHARLDPNYIERDNSIQGWHVCQDEHFKEMSYECSGYAPYLNLQLIGMALSDLDNEPVKYTARPVTVSCDRKGKDKSLLSLRKSKSVRAVSNVTLPRAWIRAPTSRFVTRFPLLYSGIKEIKYDFKPYPYHQQHLDVYRSAYTYILIRNYRQLRESGGTSGRVALRPSLKMSSKSAHDSQEKKQYAPQGSAGQYRNNVVYYSDVCQTGPVCTYPKDKTIFLKPSDILTSAVQPSTAADSSAITNTFFLPKSTMEINSITLHSQQTPLKESDNERVENSTFKAKIAAGDVYNIKKQSSMGINNAQVTGKSALGSKNKQGSIPSKRLASMGRIPVSIRRSSPSIKGKQEATSASEYLSIAVGTHTVASPYYIGDNQDELLVTKVKI